jgi:hypothetical protein
MTFTNGIMTRSLAIALSLFGSLAAADEVTKGNYPASLVERPMLAPPLQFEPTIGVGVTNVDGNGNGSGTGEVLSFGLEMGIVKRLQMGILFAFPVNPNPGFGTFLFNAQTKLSDTVSLRLDVGAEQLTLFGTTPMFVGGIGVPIKLKINRMLAFVSGATGADGFGPQPIFAGSYGYSMYFTSDVIAFAAFQNDDGSGSVARGMIGSFFVPVGFLFQPHERISFGVRSGYRLLFSHDSGGSQSSTSVAHFVPLGLDMNVNIIRQLDFKFSAMFAGVLKSEDHAVSTPSEWAAVRQFNFAVAGRF